MPAPRIRSAAVQTPDWPVAVGEATHDSFHGQFRFARASAESCSSRDGELALGVDDAQGQSAFEHIEQERAAELTAPALQEGRAVRVVAAVQVPADQVLEIGDVGHERAGELVLHATLRQRRGEEVGHGREARRFFVPRGQIGKLVFRDVAGSLEDRQDLLAAVQERGSVEVAEGFEVAAIRGWRLAIATSRSSRTTWRSGRFWRRASSSRHSASRRAISRLRRLSWCRPGSRRQRSSSARCAIDSRKSANLGLGPGRSTELRQAVGEMVGQVEEVPDIVERVVELGRSERPMPPVGAGLAAGQADAQHLPDQVDQRQRIAEADQSRGHLDVKHPRGQRSRLIRQIRRSSPAACMTTSTAGSRTTSQNGTQVADRQGVDHRQPLAGRHLDQAEHRLKRLFADKLGVEREPADRPQMIDQPVELGRRGDDLFGSRVRHQCQCSRLFRNRRMAALATDGFS